MRTVAAILFTSAALALPAAAQQPPPPAGARALQLGPVTLLPRLEVREIGVDDNVFNDAENPQRDFTATVSARVNAEVRIGWTRLTGASTLEGVYYRKFSDERAVNRSAEGRFEVGEGLVRPFLTGGIVDTSERMNAEIDTRAGRLQTNYGGGLGVVMTPRTTILVSARRLNMQFDEGEQYRGVELSRTMNSHTDQFEAGITMAITPLTTWDITGGVQYDRFDHDSQRNADGFRVTTGLAFSPSALITGRVSAGFRRFTPAAASLAAFDGIVVQAGLGYSIESTKIEGQLERDVRYSFEEFAPYYLMTAGRVVLTQQLAGPFDVQVLGGRQRLDYREYDGGDEASRRDRVTHYGGGIGYRLGDTARFGFNLEWSRRRSDELAERRYDRRRFYGTLTYGF